MLRRIISPQNLTDHEARHLAEPAVLATIALCGLLAFSGAQGILAGSKSYTLFLIGFGGIFYAVALFYLIMPVPSRLQKWKWGLTAANSVALGIALVLLPPQVIIISYAILILVAVTMVILWGRKVTYIFLAITTTIHLSVFDWRAGGLFPVFSYNASLLLLSFVIVEIIRRLSGATRSRILRLEILNDFARRISYSLESDELFELIGAAIKNAIQADTYFLGITEDNQTIHLKLLFDDGQFYPPIATDIEGTLSGWVLRNERSLFIPDLRNDVDLEGVKLVIVGKGQTSLCWMGVPMFAKHVKGVIGVASYRPNDFDRTDLELLENLGQHAALVLENAYHHAEVEAQSRLDSLTGAYNHGHIVKILEHEAEQSLANRTPISLVMLDIDYFKQYNDNYGHLLGDQVLKLLTDCMRSHIHETDSIGRWGGEEFAIVLPNTSGQQALQVAERIRQTMNNLSIQDRHGQPIPVPTVSQGIAVFPDEIEAVDRLIDLADQRLYIAKERGRNQIEPPASHWERIR
jgi:diguanylate cyclase (GGDEF)-like protein